jgi:hypothetical protein
MAISSQLPTPPGRSEFTSSWLGRGGGEGHYKGWALKKAHKTHNIQLFVRNNLEINSDLKSAKDTPPVHKNLTISVADPVSWISNQR